LCQIDLSFPFLDRDLVGFIMAIPGEVRNWHGVPRMLMRQALAGVLPDEIRQRFTKGDPTSLINEGLAAEYPRVAEYINGGMLAARYGYVIPERVKQDFLGAKSLILGETNVMYKAIMQMLGLEIWLRVYWPKGL
jgi:hypothetical protein